RLLHGGRRQPRRARRLNEAIERITHVNIHPTSFLASLAVLVLAAGSAVADIPRTADGKPDFSGIWQAASGPDDGIEAHGAREDAPPGPGIVDGGVLPYLSEALEQRDRNFAARFSADPARRCFTPGTPRGVYYPEPF